MGERCRSECTQIHSTPIAIVITVTSLTSTRTHADDQVATPSDPTLDRSIATAINSCSGLRTRHTQRVTASRCGDCSPLTHVSWRKHATTESLGDERGKMKEKNKSSMNEHSHRTPVSSSQVIYLSHTAPQIQQLLRVMTNSSLFSS